MVVDSFFTDATAILTPIIILGSFIVGGIKYMTSQAEKKAVALKESQKEIAKEVREYTDQMVRDVNFNIKNVDEKVMEMLSDLKHRADLTNGNVSVIRTEIADLQDDLQDLYEELEGSEEPDETRVIRRKLRAKKQRLKRRRIEADRVSQSERTLRV